MSPVRPASVVNSSFEPLEPRRLFAASLVGGVLTITGTARHDVIEASLEDDGKLKVEINNAEQEFDYAQVNSFVVEALAGNDSVEFNDENPILKSALIRAGAGRDTVEGTNARDVVFGGTGADRIDGRGGSDILYGELGNDFLEGKAGNDKLFGGSGNDALEGGVGNDTLDGQNGNDDLQGNSASLDQIRGGRGNDDFDNSDLSGEILDRNSEDDGPNAVIVV
jgi:Ca2+-binding RTX toxin-like protein